jgi:hypothetical protein
MKPVAYCVSKDNHIECLCFNEGYAQKHADRCENAKVTSLYTHPAKTQSNLVNVVKKHIKDLQNCVKLFRSAEMDNTANEMEVAIKELEDAINFYPAKTLTDEEIQQVLNDFDWFVNFVNPFDFARAILRKAQEK